LRGLAITTGRELALRPVLGERPAVRVVAVLGIAAVVLVGLTTHRFLTWDNVKAIFNSASLVGIMALGLTFVTLVGGIASLAVAQTAVVAAMVFLALLGSGLVPAIAVAIVVGAVVTAAQGVLIGAWNANPVILTIGAGFVIDGIAQEVHGGSIVQPAASSYSKLNSVPGGVPVAVYVLVGLTILFELLLRRTVLGRRIVLVGENRAAARAAGISITVVVTAAFALAGVGFAIGGAFLGAFNRGASTYLEGTLTFDALAAVLVGGTSIVGGHGSAVRTLGGALAIATISDVLLLRGYGTGAQLLLKGVLVVAVVVVTQARARSLEP
jgi:ribose/xylose/arabinose/galactoside ABC-type transport system permease subunit